MVTRLSDKLPLELGQTLFHISLVNQIPLLECCIIHVFLDMSKCPSPCEIEYVPMPKAVYLREFCHLSRIWSISEER